MKEATENWSRELQVQASMLAWEINKDTEDADVEAMLAKKSDNFEFVYTLLAKQSEVVECQTEVHKVLKIVARKWPDERKLRLLEFLVRDNYQSPAGMNPYTIFKILKLSSFPPFWMLYVITRQTATPAVMVTVVDHLDKDDKEAILLFLESFIALPSDERFTLLESYPFYAPEMLSGAIDLTKICETFLQALSIHIELPLTEDYYRTKRPAFINQLMGYGMEQSVSTDNAAKLILRHIGDVKDDRSDVEDALSLLAPWPVVAEKVKRLAGITAEIPRASTIHPELMRDTTCNVECHASQTQRDVKVLGSLSQFHIAQAEMLSTEMLVLVEWPRIDPRNFTPGPGFVAFKAIEGLGCYGFFPAEVNKQTKDQIYQFLSKKIIFTQSLSFKEFLIQNLKNPKPIRFSNGNMVALRECRGKHGGALSRFVWDLPYCPSTTRDWLSEALTFAQQFHISYNLELMDKLVQKITVSKIIGAYGIVRPPNQKKLKK